MPANGLVEGGADILFVETVFDSLNSRAALFALELLFANRGQRLPVMLSFTITDQSGRTLSGQTVEAYWNSVSNIDLLSVGINCALGPKEMRPYIDELSRIAPVNVSSYPNAGLPNPLLPTGFPETPETLAPQLREWAENGWLNIVGGCCGTTPVHIQKIAEAVQDCEPRRLAKPAWPSDEARSPEPLRQSSEYARALFRNTPRQYLASRSPPILEVEVQASRAFPENRSAARGSEDRHSGRN